MLSAQLARDDDVYTVPPLPRPSPVPELVITVPFLTLLILV